MTIAGTAVCVGSWTSLRPATLGAFAPGTALSHNRVRPLPWAVRDSERNIEGIGGALSAGVNRRELPSLYLSANGNENRPGTSEIFCRWYSNAGHRLNNLLPKQHRSREEEIELLGHSAARCLGNAAESIKQALDAMPDRYHGMAVATREFRAGDAFELELNQ
jgi:hypothetical protein